MFIAFIMGCVLIFEGIKAIIRYFNLKLQWEKSQTWPSTPGKIIRSKVKAVRAPAYGKKRGADGGRTAFLPDILYSYRANGEDFESGQLFFAQDSYCTNKVASDRVDQYPEGSEVTVYYNPDEPEMALLDRNRDSEISSTLTSGAAFVVIGLVMVIAALKGMLAG